MVCGSYIEKLEWVMFRYCTSVVDFCLLCTCFASVPHYESCTNLVIPALLLYVDPSKLRFAFAFYCVDF
jgi:hypothetical protein